nr:hypothetical protein [Microbacterium sp. SORGH_AS_0428]
MTSSQTLLVNLLGPLGSDPTWLLEVLRLLLQRSDIAEVIRWDIEFAPPRRSQYLGDMTRLDAFFRVRTDFGVEGLVLELKYTDRFSSRRIDVAGSQRYAELASSRDLWHDPQAAFIDPTIGQLLRCHALGERILQVDEPSAGGTTLLLVSHPNDTTALLVMDRYRAALTNKSRAVDLALDRVLAVALATAPSASAAAVVRGLQLRYLDHWESEHLWQEHTTDVARLTGRSRGRFTIQ